MDTLDLLIKLWPIVLALLGFLVGGALIYSRFDNTLKQLDKRVGDVENILLTNQKLHEDIAEIKVHMAYMRESMDELKKQARNGNGNNNNNNH